MTADGGDDDDDDVCVCVIESLMSVTADSVVLS